MCNWQKLACIVSCCILVGLFIGRLLYAGESPRLGRMDGIAEVQSEGRRDQQGLDSLMERLAAGDPGDREEREAASEIILVRHRQLTEGLIKLVRGQGQTGDVNGVKGMMDSWHGPKHLAILLLGNLRSPRAVPVLLDNLEYENPRQLAGSYAGEDTWYPAVEALSKIGMPAVDPTLQKLITVGPKSRGGDLCCLILKQILGPKLARARVQIAIEETRDEAAKKNLTAALAYFRMRRVN